MVDRLIDRMRRHFDRSQDINDYTEVDNTIERLGLKPRDRVVLDCYMAGMTCNEKVGNGGYPYGSPQAT